MSAITRSEAVEAGPDARGLPVPVWRTLILASLPWACATLVLWPALARTQDMERTEGRIDQARTVQQKLKELQDLVRQQKTPPPTPHLDEENEADEEEEIDPCAPTVDEDAEGDPEAVPQDTAPCEQEDAQTPDPVRGEDEPVAPQGPSDSGDEAGSLRGVVRDQHGRQPVPGALVAVAGGPTTITDADGRFALARLPPGTHRVTVRKRGYRAYAGTVTVSPGPSVARSFVLRRRPPSPSIVAGGTGGGLRGRVLDARTRRPVSGATISLAGGPTARTSADGRFAIPNLPARRYRVTVRRHGFSDRVETVTVLAARVARRDFRLAPD